MCRQWFVHVSENHRGGSDWPSCPRQRAVFPQAKDRLVPGRGPSFPRQRAVLSQAEGRLSPGRGPSCPRQRAVLPQAEGRLAPGMGQDGLFGTLAIF